MYAVPIPAGTWILPRMSATLQAWERGAFPWSRWSRTGQPFAFARRISQGQG